MTKGRRNFVAGTVAMLAALGGWLFFSGHTTPAGQPPLTTLTSDTWSHFKADFNASTDRVRVVVLLSPT